MQDFSSLGIEVLKYGFHPVVFLECECAEHGTFRFGVMPELAIEWPLRDKPAHDRGGDVGVWCVSKRRFNTAAARCRFCSGTVHASPSDSKA
jgi:hypothetical protein